MKKILFTLLILALVIGMAIPMAIPASAAVVTGATINVDFNSLSAGTDVTGLGTVNPYLNIQEPGGTPVVLVPGESPATYGAPNSSASEYNGGIDGAGFGDNSASRPNDFVFTFAPGISVNQFSIRMLDYGDFNPLHVANHEMQLVAYDSSGTQVGDASTLSFTSTTATNPRSSSMGDLWYTGDAVDATTGNTEPGNWVFTVSGTGITEVDLVPGAGLDPNIGFDDLSFTPQFPAEFVTGGGTVDIGKDGTGGTLDISGNAGFLPNGSTAGNLNIVDHVTGQHYVCHNDFNSMIFIGDTATLNCNFTDKSGETYGNITIIITDNGEPGTGADTVGISQPGNLFSIFPSVPAGTPINGGNFEIHSGLK